MYSGRTGSPDNVVNDVGRSGVEAWRSAQASSPARSSSLGAVAMPPIVPSAVQATRASQEKQCSAATRRSTSRIGSTAGAS